jgi:RHS repeat-associated protein
MRAFGAMTRFDNIRVNPVLPRSFSEDFADGDYTWSPAWPVSGTWSIDDDSGAEDYYLTDMSDTAGLMTPSFFAGTPDYTVTWAFYAEDVADDDWMLRHWARFNNSNGARVELRAEETGFNLLQWDGTQWSGHGSLPVALSEETWYECRAVLNGSHAELWYREQDSGNDWALAASTDTLTVTTSDRGKFVIPPGDVFRLDDLVYDIPDPEITTYACNDANELTTMCVNTEAPVTFTYDDWGRTLSQRQTVNGTVCTRSYMWWYGDKLKRISSDFPGERQVDYVYDGLGKRRVRAIDYPETWGDAEWTTWRWDLGWTVLSEHEAGTDNTTHWDIGTRTKSFIARGMLNMAEVPGSDPSPGAYRYYLQDHLGSTRALYDQSKDRIGSIAYKPYGTKDIAPGVIPDYTFTGKPFEPETGLYYFPYRYYSPQTARWMKRDPLGMVDGPNVYAYVGVDPVNNYDINGQLLLSVLIGAAAGCLIGWLTAHAANQNGGRGALCGCLGGAISGAGSGLLLGAVTSAIGAFANCICMGNDAECCVMPAILGGALGALAGWVSGSLSPSDILDDLFEGLGLASGSTLGSALGSACCE